MFGRRYTLCTSVVLAIVSFLVFVESAPTSASTSSDEAMVTSKIEKVPVTPGVSGKKCGSFQNEGKNAAGKCGGEAEGMRNDSNMLPTTDSQEVTEKLEKLPCGSFQKDGKNETGKCGGVTDLLNGSSTSESQEVTEKPPKLPCGCNSTDHVHTTTKTTTFKTTTPCKKAVTRDPSKVRRCRGVRRGRYCYTIEHGAVCWGEAKTMCEKKDSVLAIINKRPVYRAVKRLIKRKAKSKETFFWVGMSYATSLGLKKWVNNKQVDKLSYWNAYKILEEKSGPVYEGCFGINSDSWNLTAVDCATKLPFICLYDITMKNQTEFLEAPAPSKLGGAFGVVAEENIKTGAIKHHHQIDIVLTPEQQEIVKTGGDPSTATGAFRFKTTTPTQSELQELFILQTRTRRISKRRKRSADPNRVWPRGVVNYIFHQLITSNEKALIKAALSEIEQRTCIRFKEGLDSSNIGVMFNTHDPRCASEVGRQGKLQNVYLSRDSCIHTQGSIIHEMFHVLGFWHEQARPDRDDYITINWQNIEQVYRVNFQIQSHSKYAGFNYDYESIMHYPQNAMATDPSIDTIIPNPNKWRQQTLGQRFAPTEMDYMELNSLYGCDQPTNGNWGVWSEWSQCPVTCGGGTHYRTRLCNNPAPANGGNGCPGEASQTQMCMRDSCPDPEILFSWLGCWKDQDFPEMLELLEGLSSYLKEDYRIRANRITKCALAAKEHGAAIFALRFYGMCYAQFINVEETTEDYKSSGPSSQCSQGHGGLNEIDVYSFGNEPVQGQWSVWSDYTKCSKSCDVGVRYRQRECKNPQPAKSDDPKLACSGETTEKSACNSGPCPLNGGWSDWSEWSECPKELASQQTAGLNETTTNETQIAYRYRTRRCSNPAPEHGGAQCQGQLNEVETCPSKEMPVPPIEEMRQPTICLIVLPNNEIATSYNNFDCSSHDAVDHNPDVWNKPHQIELMVY